MSLFSRLLSAPRPQFRRFPDTFTLTETRKLTTLGSWVRDQSAVQSVIVLTHFQSTFLSVQESLQETEIDFDILAEPHDQFQFDARLASQDSGTRVYLTMSQMLQSRVNEQTVPPKPDPSRKLAVMVAERYPLAERDTALEDYFKQLPIYTSMGYLISFEDPILKFLLGQKFIDLMKQMGLGENDLVSSLITNRGLARKLRMATQSIENEIAAESPQEWIELNLKKQA